LAANMSATEARASAEAVVKSQECTSLPSLFTTAAAAEHEESGGHSEVHPEEEGGNYRMVHVVRNPNDVFIHFISEFGEAR